MAKSIYQIHILLRYSKPRIWRRILINANDPLSELHMAIQYSMGWLNYHLHEFRKNGLQYCPRMDDDFDYWDETCMIDYKNTKISDLLVKIKDTLVYEYDFGDGWEHDIKLEKIFDADGKLPFPVCIKGIMNCPPEDCGGIWGYYNMLDALKDPKHKMHKECKDRVGPFFKPEIFNIEEANGQLIGSFLENMDDPI